MVRRSRQTFEEMLLAVAPVNASALEEKARRAGDLAKAYPQCATLFAAVEERLLQHLRKVISFLTDGVPEAGQASTLLPPRFGLLAPENPVSTPAGIDLELEQDIGRGCALSELILRQLGLRDPQDLAELCLGESEAANLPDPPTDSLEVDSNLS